MGLTIKEIIKLVDHLEMKLVAGEAGIDNEITWTHMVDSDTISAFLQGKELVFTTGIGLNKELSLIELVKDVYRDGASGIVINIGPYVENIGQEVLDFADEKGFPVFEVPWHVHMAEIMRIICYEITRQQQNVIEISAALNNAFLCPVQEDLYVPTLMKKGYMPDGSYSVVMLDVSAIEGDIAQDRQETLVSQLSGHIRFSYKRILVCTQDKYIYLVMNNYSVEEERQILNEIFFKICSWLRKYESVVMTAGSNNIKLNNIHKSYEQSVKMNKLAISGTISGEIINDNSKLLFYTDIGVYRILLSLKDKDAMEEYVRGTVYPLLEYDKIHGTDLSGELQCYIRHDCSLQDTADELMVHRNTINYKINKAADILNMDLTRLSNRFEVSMGFLVNKMLDI
ncbi:MAG: PucR family transcriptional regulator ligand-binding domain-containing protein [Eubacteriales bacterium]|nr:PucR family transcriptional regulator ligand-binding domain-containing protein [Eubacteriales bacterium]